jgi:hypothetical protein
MSKVTRCKIVAGLVLAVLASSVAAAPAGGHTDPDDMTSPLDVRELIFMPSESGGGVLKLVSDEGWNCEYIQPRLNTLTWKFDGQADGDTDLVGRVRCVDGRPLLFLKGRDTGNRYEAVPGRKPTPRSVKFAFSFDIVEMNGRHAALFLEVSDGTAEGCTSANPCFDRAPDRGRYRLY